MVYACDTIAKTISPPQAPKIWRVWFVFQPGKLSRLSENAVFVVCLFAAADAAENLGSCLIPLARDLEILNSLGSSDPPVPPPHHPEMIDTVGVSQGTLPEVYAGDIRIFFSASLYVFLLFSKFQFFQHNLCVFKYFSVIPKVSEASHQVLHDFFRITKKYLKTKKLG